MTAGTYPKGSERYRSLTQSIKGWAEDQILLVAKYTPKDYVLPWSMNKITGEPHGPRGVAHNFASALTAYDAYTGLIPPSWGHGKYTFHRSHDPGNKYGDENQYYVGF